MLSKTRTILGRFIRQKKTLKMILKKLKQIKKGEKMQSTEDKSFTKLQKHNRTE